MLHCLPRYKSVPNQQAPRAVQSQLKRITKHLERLQQGVDVQLRDIKSVLTAEQYAAMEAAWAEQLALRKPAKPEGVKSYEQLLNKAVVLHGQLDAYSGRKPKTKQLQAGRADRIADLKNRTDRAFEDALERLQEIAAADSSVQVWFDRDLDFSFNTSIGLNPIDMPRVVTSRSMDNMGQGQIRNVFGMRTRMEIKIEALETAQMALQKQARSAVQQAADSQKAGADAAKLRGLLGKLKKRDD